MIENNKYQAYLPYIILFFFLNNVLLPHGMLYTSLLSPVFIYWLYKQNKLKEMILWGLFILIPVPFHFLSGIDPKTYVVSTALLLTAWIFLFTALKYASVLEKNIYPIFRTILIINSALLVIAILVLPFGLLRDIMWDSTPISPNIPPFPRLDLLAYEPSHYSLLLMPVFMYFFIMAMSGKLKHPLIYMFAVFLPLLLSMSFGVMAAFLLAALFVVILYFYRFPPTSRKTFIYLTIITIFLFVAFQFIFPSNPFWARIYNILIGADTSAKGRLFDSFMFASDLIAQHSIIFGVGPGQVKVLAHDLIINHYQYSGEFAEVVRIPNSMGEMLASYGIYGFLLKLAFEIYFFFRKMVYKNTFALALFIFIFTYQFTGSFMVNIAELGIWALVFACRPKELNISNLKLPEA